MAEVTQLKRYDVPRINWGKWFLIGVGMLVSAFILLVPMIYIFVQAFSKGLMPVLQNLADPDMLHAIWLTVLIALIAVPVNLVFGILLAWLVTRFNFPGRQLLLTLLDIPFAVSPVVAGLVYLLFYGSNGPLGGWLDEYNLQMMFSWPGMVLVTKEQGMEGARDLALAMSERGEGKLLDQFNNPDNPYAHYTTTGPEIWRQTSGRITHFVSSMGTTGTITGVSRFLREQEKPVTIVGLQPEEGSSIPGIRRWPAEYMPGIFNASLVDEVLDIHQNDAENTMRELAVREGIFCGVSSGGAVAGALRVARATPGAVVVAIICDRGDRYLSTGVFGEEHFSQGAGI